MLFPILILSMTDPEFDRALKAAPADIRHLAERWQGCSHWAGEEPYDKDRARQIAAAERQLGCATLERDDAALRRKYRGRRDAPALLDAARNSGY